MIFKVGDKVKIIDTSGFMRISRSVFLNKETYIIRKSFFIN